MKTRNTTTLTLSEADLHEMIREKAKKEGFIVPPDAEVTISREAKGLFSTIISATVILWDKDHGYAPPPK